MKQRMWPRVKPHLKFYNGLWHCSKWLRKPGGCDIVRSGKTPLEALESYLWWHRNYEFSSM